PRWGQLSGGDVITLTGEGFEPGNSVVDGMQVSIGGVPARAVQVPAHDRMLITVPAGPPGRTDIRVQHRNGQSAVLADAWGYGLRQLAHSQPSRIYPTDIHLDPVSGVAVTTTGLFPYSEPNIVKVLGAEVPDAYRLATFDVQRRDRLPLAGGVSSV